MAPEIIALINTLGLPTAFLVAIGWFVYKAIWPVFTKRMDASDAERNALRIETTLERKELQAQYLEGMDSIHKSETETAKILLLLEERLSVHVAVTASHYADLSRLINERFDVLMKKLDK